LGQDLSMPDETFVVVDPDGIDVVVDCWMPAGDARAVIHVMHGWAEHAGRYDRFAREANARGYAVYADDHRGHGRTAAGSLGDLGPGGMDGVLDSVHAVTAAIAARHPDLPLYVLGHSWGSFLAQRFIRHWPDDIDGLILTGTTLRVPGATRAEGGPNAPFEPAATPYDWLTRDADEVQRYIDDPWCGFERMTASAAPTTPASTTATPASTTESALARPRPPEVDLPGDLPIAIANGSVDPIGGSAGGEALAASYRDAGAADVTLFVYEGGRHEVLNETNRDQVTADLLAWIDARSVTPRRAGGLLNRRP